jgi:hypothetical protein
MMSWQDGPELAGDRTTVNAAWTWLIARVHTIR